MAAAVQPRFSDRRCTAPTSRNGPIMTTPTLLPHHDGSPLHVSTQTPALGELVRVRLRVPADYPALLGELDALCGALGAGASAADAGLAPARDEESGPLLPPHLLAT